jgi:DNA-binding transcriptional ArsR family regulator
MSGNGIKDLSSLDRVIHEPARLMIMTILFAVEEADFVYLQRECGLTQGNLSSHLSKLEEVGYLTISKTFKGKYPLTICRLTRSGRQAFQSYSTKMRFVTDAPGSPKAH